MFFDPRDASQASLKEKEQIEELSLEWDNCTTEDSQLLVLEHLQPSTNLKKLTIKFYGGARFPNWLGDSLFDNMVYLCIHGCHHCSSLPPVGQLHGLKELTISDMILVKTIGSEFYGSSSPSFQPFRSLQTLRFQWMPEWEEWTLLGGTTTEFPRLSCLYLIGCPKLKGNLPSSFPSSTVLHFPDCSLPESRFSGEMDDGNIMRPSSLFSELMLGFNSLVYLHIDGIPSVTAFPRDGLPKTLRSLCIRNCENLEFPTHESLRSYKALEKLEICRSCCSLTSFPLGSLPVLKWLFLFDCENLKSISIPEEEDAPQCLTFLQQIFIDRCPELESLSLLGFPAPKRTSFRVWHCAKLNSLPEPINTFTGLQELVICDNSNLQSFAEQGLPISIRKLRVGNDKIFSNTAITKWGLERLTCLSELEIHGDYLVKMLMEMEVPLLPSSLVSLCISDLYDIKHLDGKWLQHLTSLERLEIECGDSLESLPEEGLPSSLSVLTIRDSPLLAANCRSNGGKEWPKIAHIPCKIIDEEVII